MQTTIKHESFDFVHYIGLGASKALLLYPCWCFGAYAPSASTWGRFTTARGAGLHLGLLGVQVVRKAEKKRKDAGILPRPVAGEALPGFVEPSEHDEQPPTT